jgi:dUTP pyrophosphatase
MRKFEKISLDQFKKDFKEYNIDTYESIIMPTRKTKYSAGYDFHAPFDFVLEPGCIIKIPTGVKVATEMDEFLMIVVRSSIGFMHNVRMCNQIGVIDYDYYNNEENEGHIWIAFQNEGPTPWNIKKGDRFAQGIFVKYQIVDDEENITASRKGGLGSTNKEEYND